jgi:hypothetical protein
MQIQVSLTVEIDASAGINEMEQQIKEAGQQAMRQAMKQAVRQWEDQQRVCAQCGQRSSRLEGTARRVIATSFGRVTVQRRRFRCLACGHRSCPATRLFADLKGATMTPCLQKAAQLAGCSWPYRAAAQVLHRLSGAQISAEEIRLLTNRAGKQRAALQQAEAEQVCASLSAPERLEGSESEQPLLVGLDGGWVCSREQRGGMEGKVGVICSQMEDLPLPVFDSTFSWSKRGGPRRPPRQRHRLSKRRYVATFGPSRQIGEQAKAAAQALDATSQRPVVVIADGAAWIKKEQGKHFPQATCILDWAHLWREVRQAILAAARGKALSEQTRDYQLYLQRTRLWLGSIDLALQGLGDLAKDLPAESLKPVREAIRYIEHQRSWMGSYEQWRKQGYPVGSGMIERAVSLVINRRMKKRGMRWCRSNATAIVALRADVLNEDWITAQQSRAFP